MSKTCLSLIVSVAIIIACGCERLDEERIPVVPVSINLANSGLWSTYGVSAFGQNRYFIKATREPVNFYYTAETYTGYGGILLISGMDPYTSEPNIPLAYDLSCPVERQPDIRVVVDPESLEAICPVCHSHYDVVMAGGVPVSGEALQRKYRLKMYKCFGTPTEGYMISR